MDIVVKIESQIKQSEYEAGKRTENFTIAIRGDEHIMDRILGAVRQVTENPEQETVDEKA
jgi:hypothetical protein